MIKNQNLKMVIMAAVGLSIASQLMINPMTVQATGSGLKVNLVASSNTDGMGRYCVSGGGETICQNAEIPGQVQVQFGKGQVPDGASIEGCVHFNGRTECDNGTNGEQKAPENLSVFFSGSSGGGSNSQAQAQSQSQTQEQSQSQAQSQSICLIGPCD